MKKGIGRIVCTSLFLFLIVFYSNITQAQEGTLNKEKSGAGLVLPAGFKASIVADNLGRARHIAVTPQGDIYVRLARTSNGKGTLMLHEAAGKATVKSGFGNFGGTGIYIKDGYL